MAVTTKDYKLLRVFVASPTDVGQERLAVREIIDDLNQGFASTGLRIEFVGWETVSPGFGSDAQDVINQQIGEDYSVFVGILWARFGTPTERAGSGTAEEFERAYARLSNDDDPPVIMLYFSDVAIPPSEVDTNQLEKVRAFRDKVSKLGGLYHAYQDHGEFSRKARIDLTRIVLDRLENEKKTRRRGGIVGSAPIDEASKPDRDDQEGLFDLIEQGLSSMELATSVLLRITSSITSLNDSFNIRTRAIGLESDTPSTDPQLLREFFDGVGDDLTQLADSIEPDTRSLADAYAAAMDRYGRASTMLSSIAPEDKESLYEILSGVRGIISALETSVPRVEYFRDVLDRMPPFSTALNRAKLRGSEALDTLLKEWRRELEQAADLQDLLVRLAARQ